MHCAHAIVGGNWNNDLNAGPFYINLNNTPDNTNTNIGAALSYPREPSYMSNAVHIAAERSKGGASPASPFPHRLVKINSVQAPVSI